MITAHNLSTGYRRNSEVLQGMSFTLEPGLIHGLIGCNGSGKTTLLRVLAGQLAADGEVEVFGEPPFDRASVMDRLESGPRRRAGVAFRSVPGHPLLRALPWPEVRGQHCSGGGQRL